ncbi:MAG: acetyl-CoA C-acyltransferase [Gammaproteobacteria bacterium]|nr:MAG: acetyl-CoA C-acyltransferase [Gammaproteobacteria bacterium]
MADAYIVAGTRTAGGRKGGRLREWHPADLGAAVLDEIVRKTKVPGEKVDDVIFGCVSQIGAQTGNLARNSVLGSSLPISVPGTTVDRQCGSSQQALHFAAQAIMSGTQDVVIAGGVESMTRVPMGAAIMDALKEGHGQPWDGKKIVEKYPNVQFNQFMGAEMVAKEWDITREQLDEFALTSHLNASKATKEGRFNDELLVLEGLDKEGNKVAHDSDEGIRHNSTLEGLQSLNTLAPKGRITAGTSSQICDGASAVMLVSEKALKELNLTPLARIHSLALAGTDPVMMLAGPIPATQTALERVGLTLDDIDLYELNEAFGSVPLAWAKELGADLSKLNVNGGAQALGHPLGATGTKLMTTLVYELKRRGGKYGLLAICEGGGTANATIIEAC